MRIRYCNIQTIEKALEIISKTKYDGNIIFNRTPTPKGKDSVLLTLSTKSSKEKGSGRAPQTKRRLVTACWHAHRDFFAKLLELCPNAEIKTQWSVYTADNQNWVDFQPMQGIYASTLCECNE